MRFQISPHIRKHLLLSILLIITIQVGVKQCLIVEQICISLLTGNGLFETPQTVAHQASLSITTSWSLLKLMSIESVMPSNHLILCHPLLLPPAIFPSIRVFRPYRIDLSVVWIIHSFLIKFPYGKLKLTLLKLENYTEEGSHKYCEINYILFIMYLDLQSQFLKKGRKKRKKKK